ncbi:hypothetical protein F5884DRAFT_788900 [Xylogone sp. PMI_703]|nr:hypothetical protein F5884DRAFT_788900 [Xylogone sp. PMI_703]
MRLTLSIITVACITVDNIVCKDFHRSIREIGTVLSYVRKNYIRIPHGVNESGSQIGKQGVSAHSHIEHRWSPRNTGGDISLLLTKNLLFLGKTQTHACKIFAQRLGTRFLLTIPHPDNRY